MMFRSDPLHLGAVGFVLLSACLDAMICRLLVRVFRTNDLEVIAIDEMYCSIPYSCSFLFHIHSPLMSFRSDIRNCLLESIPTTVYAIVCGR